MFTSPIIPALIPNSVANMSHFLTQLGSVPEVHIDVVDGIFVPYKSWPYLEAAEVFNVSEVHRLFKAYTLEVDLMVTKPIIAAKQWIEAGADMLVFHIETVSAEALQAFSEEYNVTIGVSAVNDTLYEDLKPYLKIADYVQVMGIDKIGAQGQPLDDRGLSRVQLIRNDFPRLPISFDGSVNSSTLHTLASLKLERYIMGSAITKAANPRLAYQQFTATYRQQLTEA